MECTRLGKRWERKAHKIKNEEVRVAVGDGRYFGPARVSWPCVSDNAHQVILSIAPGETLEWYRRTWRRQKARKMNNHKKSQKHKGPLEGAAALGLGQPYTLSLDQIPEGRGRGPAAQRTTSPRGLRTIEAAKKRGRWTSDVSVTGNEHRVRLAREWHKLTEQSNVCLRCEDQVENTVYGQCFDPPEKEAGELSKAGSSRASSASQAAW